MSGWFRHVFFSYIFSYVWFLFYVRTNLFHRQSFRCSHAMQKSKKLSRYNRFFFRSLSALIESNWGRWKIKLKATEWIVRVRTELCNSEKKRVRKKNIKRTKRKTKGDCQTKQVHILYTYIYISSYYIYI